MKKVAFYLVFAFCVHVGFSQTKNTGKTIKIFPNPATNVINVLGLENDPNASIIITDAYGSQVVYHKWNIKNNALNIPVLNLDTGIYLITIQSEHQYVQSKFYKQY